MAQTVRPENTTKQAFGFASGAGGGGRRGWGAGSETGMQRNHGSARCAGDGERLRRCSSNLQVIGVSGGMIAPPAGARIWIAAGVTDLRRGFTGLSAAVQTVLEQDPYGGHVFVFRGAAWRSSEVVVVGWRRALSIREATGTRSV